MPVSEPEDPEGNDGIDERGVHPGTMDVIAWQSHFATWPEIRAVKRRSFDLLSGKVLDVGCGLGKDVVELGHAIGIDQAAIMLRRARHNGAVVALADATALPFRTDSFDGARAERVIQHIGEPERAIREMQRVTRPGGRVVVVDVDRETLAIHVPGAPRDLVDRVKAHWRDHAYRNGRIASELPALFHGSGFHEISVEVTAVARTDPHEAWGLADLPRFLATTGVAPWTPSDAEVWDEGIANHGFLATLVYHIVYGTSPG